MGDPEMTHDQAQGGQQELLQTVVFAAERLLSPGDRAQALREILPALARSADASRVAVLQEAEDPGGPAPGEKDLAWTSDGSTGDGPSLDVPIFAHDARWGRLRLERPSGAPAWSDEEVLALHSLTGVLGASIEGERKERAFHDAEARYRTLIEQIPAITYVDVCEGPDVDNWPTEFISPQVETVLG
ncbi:MAG: hypothetical protein M3O84_02845, partial [Actinomycetota bacterium]|nr:hypothetical protein [Actinomycetota bacterium]